MKRMLTACLALVRRGDDINHGSSKMRLGRNVNRSFKIFAAAFLVTVAAGAEELILAGNSGLISSQPMN